MTRAIFLEL